MVWLSQGSIYYDSRKFLFPRAFNIRCLWAISDQLLSRELELGIGEMQNANKVFA